MANNGHLYEDLYMLKIYGYSEDVNRCVPCISAKRLLDSKNLPYEFISVASLENGEVVIDETIKSEILKARGLPDGSRITMPQIFNGTEFIGGFTELREWLRGYNA